MFPWDTLRDRVHRFVHLGDDRHIVGTFVSGRMVRWIGGGGLSRCSRFVGARGCAALSSVRVVAAASAALPIGDAGPRGLRISPRLASVARRLSVRRRSKRAGFS